VLPIELVRAKFAIERFSGQQERARKPICGALGFLRASGNASMHYQVAAFVPDIEMPARCTLYRLIQENNRSRPKAGKGVNVFSDKVRDNHDTSVLQYPADVLDRAVEVQIPVPATLFCRAFYFGIGLGR
jgi:hypothetical protein